MMSAPRPQDDRCPFLQGCRYEFPSSIKTTCLVVSVDQSREHLTFEGGWFLFFNREDGHCLFQGTPADRPDTTDGSGVEYYFHVEIRNGIPSGVD